MSTDPAYFTSAEDGTFEPTQFAQSHCGQAGLVAITVMPGQRIDPGRQLE